MRYGSGFRYGTGTQYGGSYSLGVGGSVVAEALPRGRGSAVLSAAGGAVGATIPAALGSRVAMSAGSASGTAAVAGRNVRARLGGGAALAAGSPAGTGWLLRGGSGEVLAVALPAGSAVRSTSGAGAALGAALPAGRGSRFVASRGSAAALAELAGTLAEALLAAEDAEFFWEPGGDLYPVVGLGQPEFSRPGAAAGRGLRGDWRTLIRDIARIEWLEVAGERRPALLLELGRTNRCHRTVGFAASGTLGWAVSGSGATLSVVDDTAALAAAGYVGVVPDGRVLKLVAGSTAALLQASGSTGSVRKHTVSAVLRGTGSAAVRLSGASGTLRPLPSSYERWEASLTPGSASDVLQVEASAGSTVYLVLPQLEEGEFATTPVPNPTGAAMVRPVEQFGWAHPPQPGALSVYAELVAGFGGGGGLPGSRVFDFGAGDYTAPGLAARWTATGFELVFTNGSATTTAPVAAGVHPGDTVELLAHLESSSAGQFAVCINRGAVLSAEWPALAGGLPAAWSKLWLNGSAGYGAARGGYTALKVVTGLPQTRPEGRMRALREFDVTPSGE